jgi:hypothetical protein
LSFLLETEKRDKISSKNGKRGASQTRVLRIGQFFTEESAGSLSYHTGDSESYTIDFNEGQRECFSNDTDTDGSFQYYGTTPHLHRGNSEPIVNHSHSATIMASTTTMSKKLQMHKRLRQQQQRKLLKLNAYLEPIYQEESPSEGYSMDHPNEDSIHIFLNSLANGSNISILFAD